MNLVIGNNSQLAQYFPDDYEKISPRNIDFEKYKTHYDRVYICFAEQRTYIKDDFKIFFDTNVEYTFKVIDHFSSISNTVIVYGTSELWNNCIGAINVDMSFDYRISNYVESKKMMTNQIHRRYKNVIILHPFNFNSIYRKDGFLFSKIFDSIINKKQITIGNTYFYRELLHPKFVVNQSINATHDDIIGSGRLIFVNDFIRSLYSHFDLKYEKYVIEDSSKNITNSERIFYLDSKEILYSELDLFNDTIIELANILNKPI